jgi:hypothetical protein
LNKSIDELKRRRCSKTTCPYFQMIIFLLNPLLVYKLLALEWYIWMQSVCLLSNFNISLASFLIHGNRSLTLYLLQMSLCKYSSNIVINLLTHDHVVELLKRWHIRQIHKYYIHRRCFDFNTNAEYWLFIVAVSGGELCISGEGGTFGWSQSSSLPMLE